MVKFFGSSDRPSLNFVLKYPFLFLKLNDILFFCFSTDRVMYFSFFQADGAAVLNAVDAKVIDLFITKYWAIKFATSAACTVLRVDQVSKYLPFEILWSSLELAFISSIPFTLEIKGFSCFIQFSAFVNITYFVS